MDIKDTSVNSNDQPQINQETIDFLRNFDKFHNFEQNLSEEPEKLSNVPHEIVFNITANALEENNKGEKVRSKKICTKYYHIPVPLGADYNVFMDAFFKFLEESLASAASKTYDKTNSETTTSKPTEENNNE